jgi:hypothetical protein
MYVLEIPNWSRLTSLGGASTSLKEGCAISVRGKDVPTVTSKLLGPGCGFPWCVSLLHYHG